LSIQHFGVVAIINQHCVQLAGKRVRWRSLQCGQIDHGWWCALLRLSRSLVGATAGLGKLAKCWIEQAAKSGHSGRQIKCIHPGRTAAGIVEQLPKG